MRKIFLGKNSLRGKTENYFYFLARALIILYFYFYFLCSFHLFSFVFLFETLLKFLFLSHLNEYSLNYFVFFFRWSPQKLLIQLRSSSKFSRWAAVNRQMRTLKLRILPPHRFAVLLFLILSTKRAYFPFFL